MFKISPSKPINSKYADREISVANFIPYKCHWNHNTLLGENNELIKVIKVGGFSFETADDEDLDIQKNIRNMLFKGLATGSLNLFFHIIRRKQNIIPEDNLNIDPNIKIKKDFTTLVDKEWKKKHQNNKAFTNELYITIIRKSKDKGVTFIENIYKNLIQKADKSAWERDMRDYYEELEEATNRLITALNNYNVKVLGVVERNGCLYSEILEFKSKIINCGASPNMFMPHMDISHYLANSRLFFGNKSIEIRNSYGSKYAGIVSIKEYGPKTMSGMLDGFLQMPFEFVLTQSFNFINRQVAITKMQMQQNRMIQAGDKAITQIAEITAALDMAMGGDIGFGEHHLTVMCIDDSLKSLENSIAMAAVEISNTGCIPIREKVNLEPCFWGQLPGNDAFIVRKATINTLNLAGFNSFHNFPVGKAKENHWGEYVTIFDTTSGTPYYFNFHLRDVGHTLIIGPTGAGKTVLMNFLCAQAQKFKCRMFFFDKDRGAEIFIRALGGVYNVISPGGGCNFNPLKLPDTSQNRTFLLDLLKLLVTVNNEPLTSEDIALLNSAINGTYKLAAHDRKFSNIAAFLGIEKPGSIASRFAMWHGNGSHAKVFDNDNDSLDFTKSKVFGFEMAELLKDSISLAPVLSYVFHKINISLDGTPTMIVLDEAWALIDNPVFAPKIKDWLKVLRKLNTFVIFATQSVEDASKSQISDTLIQQTATQIFLPNLKATDVYRSSFMLSEREYALIKTTDPSSRFFLVKQGTDAVVARINLSGMTDIINVLSGRSETILLLDEIRKEVGDNPEDWLPVFYDRVKKVN
ncbi:VirB4 family type IV secretion/conjugal transfer ATPase [Rickettsiales endosymbiont of Stachyamoeba lipophora]|uniref:VirB4 family type IV secretion/conjugal transfer ATPase n=1 Tax=Rickettsiales endosymbiont of Stachyamoeba lipophora TaxID=2486578 RepID=UPI000F651593|nr:VirB4 family type IV secretion/conjugal transfer ATPase [Rickettsiales endosymbiont of Stachyamoeba lipophora]AZL15807.1 VirB4 family type IV secretion/conjugal transfer ATPase [Rickettsiales endosymbiont of Stachyamoeba lipophora]